MPGAVHIVAVGGNSEAAATSLSGHSQTLRGLIQGKAASKLANILLLGRASIYPKLSCSYYSWTGAPEQDDWWLATPPMHWNGASRIFDSEGRRYAGAALIIVGWSNGGDTAYNYARRAAAMGQVAALITLDPVSRLTSLHWLPFMGDFVRPDGVRHWFHAYTASHGAGFDKEVTAERRAARSNPGQAQALQTRLDETSRFSFGNVIAELGGAWGAQANADLNLLVPGNHGHVVAMLQRITMQPAYQDFVHTL